jgi:hypothetical protein
LDVTITGQYMAAKRTSVFAIARNKSLVFAIAALPLI